MPTVLTPPSPVKRVATPPRQPRLGVAWESRGHSFRSSLAAYLTGPKPLKRAWAGPYFRDSRIEMRFPIRAVTASFIWHVAILFIIPLPFWARLIPAAPQRPFDRVELTWYQPEPERDLPPLTLPGAPEKPSAQPSPPGEPSKPLPRRGADAYHPRQTILSQPARITHPRQTLIRPSAPPVAPKILPQLPNIVEWSDSAQPKPRLGIRPSPSAPKRRRSQHFQVPEAPNLRKNPGDANFAANPAPQPKLPLAASAPARRRAPQTSVPEAPNLRKNPGDVNFATNPAVQPKLPVVASAPAQRGEQETAVPEAPSLQRNPGELNFAANPVVNPQPRMPVVPSAPVQRRRDGGALPEAPDLLPSPSDANLGSNSGSAPQPRLPMTSSAAGPASRRRTETDAGPAPEIGASSNGDAGMQRFIALSATPAPVPPPVKPPEGNLSARLTMSPEGTQRGVPGGSINGPAATTGGAGAKSSREAVGGTGSAPASRAGSSQAVGSGGKAAPGPIGVTISPGRVGLTSPVSGPSGTTAGTTVARPGTAASPEGNTARNPVASSAPPAPKAALTQPQPEAVNPSRTPAMGMENIEATATPEQILGDKRIYTLYVNMPNLTSSTGSWVLNFAELDSEGIPGGGDDGDLSGPVPIRKVDPKYPPALIAGHVEGEVILYAIIRRDGSVDSIQLLKGVEPQLDQNAMEALARWKFRPALRHGTPIELESVVHIPFRSTPPA